MIRFIDPNTGNVYNGDKPYVHWLGGSQSLGLNYDKQLIVLTDAEYLDINIDSEVFFLVDNHKIGYPTDEQGKEVSKEMYGKKYLDLDVLKSKHIYRDLSEGATVNGYNVFTFNIIACGLYVGEITDSFFINGKEFTIGADFIDENESLGINLNNMGVEISNEVQRAIYEKTINEQKVDWVLLNRKFKELLNEYVSVIANKGSYKSLINSLKWFEYGDLVKIYEYWRFKAPNKDFLSQRELTQYISKELESLLYSMQKTTCIGISCAVNKIARDTDGGIRYEHEIGLITDDLQLIDEPVPELQDRTMLWTKEEMALKMTLLGNFFATYFMPIHLDLINSTLERTIFSNTIKSIIYPFQERTDIHDGINRFDCKVEDDLSLSEVETFTNINTPFGFEHNRGLSTSDENLPIIGVDTEYKYDLNAGIDNIKAYNAQHFKGIGAIVPFKCTLYDVLGSATISDGNIMIYHNGALMNERSTTNISHTPDPAGQVHINFSILLQNAGNYKVQLSFRRSDGVTYMKTVNFHIGAQHQVTLDIYKVEPILLDTRDINGKPNLKWIQESISEKVLPMDNIADYVLDPLHNHSDKGRIYMQFLALSNDAIRDKVHANQIIIIKYTKTDPQTTPLVELRPIGVDNKQPYYDLTGIAWFNIDKYGRFIDPVLDTVISEWGGGEICYKIGINLNLERPLEIVSKDPGVQVWIENRFVPYLYKLTKLNNEAITDNNLTDEDRFKRRVAKESYKINKDDVICFLPNIRSSVLPNKFMWEYKCRTDNSVITPKTFREISEISILSDSEGQKKIVPNDNRPTDKRFPTIVQPFFGKYEIGVIPSKGFYDVTLHYKLDNSMLKSEEKTVTSSFIIE